MTIVTIELPDDLARLAEEAGFFKSEKLEAMFRRQLREAAGPRLEEFWAKLKASPLSQMTEDEIQADVQGEIDAYRAERRAARS